MMDEPSLGLAPKFVETIFEVIREINTRGTTILLVEQNAHMALSIASRGYVMESGRIVLEDDATSLMVNKDVQKAYLGG
jgi:branched-chain amino acid transport system ATP-binding protein